LYRELLALSPAPGWQVPLLYQLALAQEHLAAPQQAVITYDRVLQQDAAPGANHPPHDRVVLDMARWRKDHATWLSQAQRTIAALQVPLPSGLASAPP
jgi:hypothetical protein